MLNAFVLAANLMAIPATCTTVQPGSDWICVNGGWLPPGHPDIPVASSPYTTTFQVGHTYRRPSTGATIFVVSLGRARNGATVLATECLSVSPSDQCYFPGQGRFILANATINDWVRLD